MSNVSAPVLGQLLLMQSVLDSLPDEPAIFSFVCRGLSDLPGVREVEWCTEFAKTVDETSARFQLLVGSAHKGELILRLADRAAFTRYEPYVRNFCFMVALILKEREQRRLNQAHQAELEERVEERTEELVRSRDDSERARRALLDTLEDQTQAEAALRESEEKYRTILERMEEGFAEVDLKGTYVFVNDSFCRITGRSRSELLGVNYKELFDREHCQLLFDTYHKVYETGEPVKGFEYEVTRKDGTKRIVEESVTLKRDAEGRPIGFTGTRRDCTERKLADEALRQSEERYRDLVENAQDIIYSHDLAGNYTSSNKAAEQITGYSPEEALKLNFTQTIAPEYLEQARQMVARKLGGEETTAYELELIAKDGHRVPVEVNTRLVLENGVPVAVQGIARDISERRVAEAELRRLAAAVEQTADSVVITDLDGNIQYVNPAFERISGYAKEEVLEQNSRILKGGKTDHVVYEELWQTITQGKVWTGRLTNRRKDGTLFEERVTISPVRDKTDRIVSYIAVKQDISDLMHLEDQLRQSQKLEAIGQLAGGVAHDFNNLLTAINGYSSLALQKLEGNPTVQNYLEEIKKAGDRAANLTRQLLAFGRKQILQPMPINLNDVVADMNKMLRRLIGEDIQLSAKLTSDLKSVTADPGQIEQVLVNLVVNARDAMPQGGSLTIETANVELDRGYASTHVGVQPGAYVVLAVSDTGTGMDEEVLRHIFEPFFTTKEKGKGTGLGLSTVYGIVKQSGGSISAYSEPNRGTTFKVYLPALNSAPKISGAKPAEIAIPKGSETVLLVEDEEVVRGLASQILEQAGYRVLVAARGEEAIRLGSEHAKEIHLLLTDVVMPGAGGKEVATRLSSICPKIKVLFMSGYTDEAIVHHGILDSDVEFIQKPFTPAALAIKVREVLDSNGTK